MIDTQHKRFLVVEDTPMDQAILKRFLGAHGSVDVTYNGREAVRAFTRALDGGTPYHVVCMDIMMPVLDGHEATAQMREAEESRGVLPDQQAAILMITCLSDADNQSRALFENRATEYLPKPFTEESLKRKLAHMRVIDL